MVYANASDELGGSLYYFSLFENICFFYKTSFHFFGWGVNDSILWLSFDQHKGRPKNCATSANFKKLLKVNNRPRGVNSSRLFGSRHCNISKQMPRLVSHVAGTIPHLVG
jgi:hypothetical protein